MRRGKRYTPQALRSKVVKAKKKKPVRKVLNNDKTLTDVYREKLMLLSDALIDCAELLLDCEIHPLERANVQNIQDILYDMTKEVKEYVEKEESEVGEKVIEKHENRVEFLMEMIGLSTLVKSRDFVKTQKMMTNYIKKMYRIK